MFLTIIGLILPPISILFLGTLLIIAPQQEALKHHSSLKRMIRPGYWAETTTGLSGVIFSVTKTHIILGCPDGTKHEILHSLICIIKDTPHETGI